MDSLVSKTLVMIVAPTAVGKSSLMNQAAKLSPDFRRVKSFTTRLPRSNDEYNQYFYITQEQLDAHLEAGEVLTDVISPTTNVHYGTVVQSYDGDYNLLDTLASSVDIYRALPFHKTITMSLTTDIQTWEKWLAARYPEPSEERTKRLEEARMSVSWSLEQTEDHCWLVNEPDNLAYSAQQLIDIATGKKKPISEPPESAQDMLDAIDKILSSN
jgi:guanylate kinase